MFLTKKDPSQTELLFFPTPHPIIPPLGFRAWPNDLSQLVTGGPAHGSWRPCPESPSWLGILSTPYLVRAPNLTLPPATQIWEAIVRKLLFADVSPWAEIFYDTFHVVTCPQAPAHELLTASDSQGLAICSGHLVLSELVLT